MATEKVQFNTRVPAEVKDMADNRRRVLGLSANEYVEKLVRADHEKNPPAPAQIDGQVTLEDVLKPESAGEAETSSAASGGALTPPAPAEMKPFEASCSNVTYHWRCGPGNPCRRCGGEI